MSLIVVCYKKIPILHNEMITIYFSIVDRYTHKRNETIVLLWKKKEKESETIKFRWWIYIQLKKRNNNNCFKKCQFQLNPTLGNHKITAKKTKFYLLLRNLIY